MVGNIWAKSKQSWKGAICWDVAKENVRIFVEGTGGATTGLA